MNEGGPKSSLFLFSGSNALAKITLGLMMPLRTGESLVRPKSVVAAMDPAYKSLSLSLYKFSIKYLSCLYEDDLQRFASGILED
jgi:hypothetical protein